MDLAPIATLGNVGVPMLIIVGPVMLVALLPIILIEGFVMKAKLELSARWAFGVAAIANFVSTLIGIPLMWIALFALQLVTGGSGGSGDANILSVTWQAPWLLPFKEDLDWMIPAAALFLCIPFYLTSAITEYIVAHLLLPRRVLTCLWGVMWMCNGITYACLAAFWLLLLALAGLSVVAEG